MKESYDLIIVGGGIGGIVALHYAQRAGLNAVVLEKAPIAGGLWAQLPSWQDIQQPCLDWTVDDLPIAGEHQPHIHQNILAWIQRFDLASGIELSTPVISAQRIDPDWVVHTPKGVLRSRHLLAATGVQNIPVIPNIPRSGSNVVEYHSSTLRDPTDLRGRDVVVVGGGASAYDLLELSLIHEAKSIRWVCRSAKWMAPTGKPKNVAGSIRWLGALQMQGVDRKTVSQQVHNDLKARYEKYGLQRILPNEPFDFGKHQLIPGRQRLVTSFEQIDHIQAEVIELTERSVELSNGQRFPPTLFCGARVTTWIFPCSRIENSAKLRKHRI